MAEEVKKTGKFKDFLKKKDIEISWKRYFIDAMGAMANGLFACLRAMGALLRVKVPGTPR